MRSIRIRAIKTRLKKRLSSLSFWRLNISSWLLFGLACLGTRVYYYAHLEAGLTVMFANLFLSVGLSSLMREVFRKTSLRSSFSLRTISVVVLASLIAGSVQSVLVQRLVNGMNWGSPELSSSIALAHRMEFTSLLFIAWSLGYYGLRAKIAAYKEMRRSIDLRTASRNMELQLLRNRLEPHFLFNSLNGIAAEIAQHPAAARELVYDVSDYLRYLLDHRDQVTAPLSEELKAMNSYLKIERTRFGERIQTSIDASRTAQRTLVPSFLLQPLVENAVKHARWPEEGPLRIAIHCMKSGPTLSITVTNSGALNRDRHEGLGLSTLMRLLELQYPMRHEFSLQNDDKTVVARLILQGTPCSVC